MTPGAPHGRDRPHGDGGGAGGSPAGSGTLPPDPPYASPDGSAILDQGFDAASLYALRSAVDAHATEAGMPPGRAEDVVISVHELATNAIRHGAGSGRARLWRLPGALRCQIDDGEPAASGRGRGGASGERRRAAGGHDGAPHGGNAADAWPYEYGHGLWLVRYAADGLGLWSGPGGTRAAVIFAMPEPGPRPFRLARRALGGPPGRPRVLLTVSGDLDREAGADLLGAAADVAAAGPHDLIVDLTGIAYSDVAGVAAVATLRHRIEEGPPATLTVVATGVMGRRLHQGGLAGRLILADSVEQALRAPSGAGTDGANGPGGAG